LEEPVEIWGEDALLQWPNARQPVIYERDAYMARTIWAAATGVLTVQLCKRHLLCIRTQVMGCLTGAATNELRREVKKMAANAHAGLPASPAYIADSDAGRRVWRYVMPAGAPDQAAPSGHGEGEYKPLQEVQTVVAVVGSAHVRGIIREWGKISPQDYLNRLNGLLAEDIQAR
jgi:hypothetical protein